MVTVDGTPVQEVLAELSRVARAMDLDAGFNMLFPSQGKTAAGWTTDLFYAGSYLSLDADQTVLGLADGSTLSFINAAVPQIDFTGIRSGADLHRAVEVLGPIVRRSSTSGGAVNTTPASPFVQQPPDSIRSTAAASKMVEERQAFCRPVVDPDAMALRRTWPAPVDSHYDGYAAGYFLDSPGYSNVAVLQLGSFGNPRATSEICDIKEFHRFIGSFVVRALDANKTRLIVDVRSNPGGAEGILGDAFDHLFPGVVPDFRWRTRATPAVDWLGNASYIPGTDTADRVVIFTGLRNPDSTPTANASFPTWRDFFGPRTIRNDNFTRLSARNMRTERARFEIDFLPANLTRQLVTSPGQDLVVLTDGDCHSSCALLVGWLTRQLGARVVMVGGRPTTGKPVAAVGGTKGASVYDWDAFVVSVSIAAGELGITRVSGLPQNVPLPPLTAPPINVVVRQLNTMDVWITADDDDKAAAAVPVHFLHEPADCRLFNTPATLASPEAMWKAVADVAWAGKRCTPGSTGTPNDVMRGTVPQVSPGSAAVTVRDARAADRVTENFRLLLDSLPARLRTRETVALRRAASERREWGAATVVLEP